MSHLHANHKKSSPVPREDTGGNPLLSHRMHTLADLCIEYLHGALPEVLRLPIDLSCVSDTLLAQLAALFEPEEIEKLRDKKDKISSRLYAKKIEVLLAHDSNMLHRCTFCSRLFTSSQREWEPCLRAPPLLDFHGNAIAECGPRRKNPDSLDCSTVCTRSVTRRFQGSFLSGMCPTVHGTRIAGKLPSGAQKVAHAKLTGGCGA